MLNEYSPETGKWMLTSEYVAYRRNGGIIKPKEWNDRVMKNAMEMQQLSRENPT